MVRWENGFHPIWILFVLVAIVLIALMGSSYAYPDTQAAGTFWLVILNSWVGLWFIGRELGLPQLYKKKINQTEN